MKIIETRNPYVDDAIRKFIDVNSSPFECYTSLEKASDILVNTISDSLDVYEVSVPTIDGQAKTNAIMHNTVVVLYGPAAFVMLKPYYRFLHPRAISFIIPDDISSGRSYVSSIPNVLAQDKYVVLVPFLSLFIFKNLMTALDKEGLSDKKLLINTLICDSKIRDEHCENRRDVKVVTTRTSSDFLFFSKEYTTIDWTTSRIFGGNKYFSNKLSRYYGLFN